MQPRVLLRKVFHEVLAGARLEVKDVGVQEVRAVRGGRLNDLSEALLGVGDAGDNGREEHAGADSGLHEPLHDLQPLPRRRRAGFKFLPEIWVHGGDAEGDGCSRAPGGVEEDVDVALDHGALGHELQGRSSLGEGFDAAAGEALAALDGLVGVCRGADGHDLATP